MDKSINILDKEYIQWIKVPKIVHKLWTNLMGRF